MKRFLLIGLLCIVAISAYTQAKKPTIMVVPSDVWCFRHGYYTTFDNQGSWEKIPNYKQAFQSNTDLLNVIGKINDLMADRGFPLKNLESALKSLEQRTAEDNMTISKRGSEMGESSLDRLKRSVKADIIMQLTWSVNINGPKRSITYSLQGIDAYTDKQIAGAQGTGADSYSAAIPVLLEEAVLGNMDNFNSRLQAHFDDLLTNGREITVAIRVFDGTGVDLETEFQGVELTEIIDDWMNQNTVNHRYSKSDGSENYLEFEQVRIPIYDTTGKAMDADAFIRNLRKYLAAPPFNITSKVMIKGLGRTQLVLGEK